jgi:hypothetical protein
VATVGDKVTDTIVNALGKGIEGAADKHKERLGALVKPLVQSYLASLPEDHPTKKALASFESNSSFTDILAWVIGFIPGIVMIVMALGEPYQEEGRQWAHSSNPLKIASPSTLVQAELLTRPTSPPIDEHLQKLGYGVTQRDIMRKALTRPLEDQAALAAAGRGLMGEAELNNALLRLGYTPQSVTALKALWFRLPPVQDLIRMAVKEAFTPEIAEKFGQYADLPAKFLDLAAKVGLNAEVAGWYWASHWELPSTTQGYEMLHRGVIKEEELDLLLRAQDVMPWWRDKLKAVAYSPLTRVDVRRMYHLGVLTEAQVVQAYKALGYDQANAEKLLEFTKAYYGPEDEDPEEEDREWTKSEILDGYRKGVITQAEARTALLEMGYNDAKISFYVAREEYKAVQTRKDAYVSRWKSLYVEGIASADEVSTGLQDVGVTSSEVNELLALWYLERLQKVAKPTRADLNRMLKKGIITESQWTQQMQMMGYAEQYIQWYLADAQGE